MDTNAAEIFHRNPVYRRVEETSVQAEEIIRLNPTCHRVEMIIVAEEIFHLNPVYHKAVEINVRVVEIFPRNLLHPQAEETSAREAEMFHQDRKVEDIRVADISNLEAASGQGKFDNSRFKIRSQYKKRACKNYRLFFYYRTIINSNRTRVYRS